MKEHARPRAAAESARHAYARKKHGLLEIDEMRHRVRSLRVAANTELGALHLTPDCRSNRRTHTALQQERSISAER